MPGRLRVKAAKRIPAIMAGCLAACLAACVSRPAEPTPVPERIVRTARLVFVGDVMSHSPQVAAAKTPTGYDYSEVFRHFRPIFGGNGHSESSCVQPETIAVANLETTLRTAPPYTGYPMFAAPAELAFAMRKAGIGIATTANNHICDKGARGIRSTLALLDSAGIRHTGAFLDSADRRARNPLRFEAGGLRFALLAYTYGTNGLPVPDGMMVNLIDTAVIARDLALARTDSTDCVIVSYHWGEEYRTSPSRAQRELAAWTRARGADLIIGGHPHVVQPMEAYYNADSSAVTGATYYSLGNFVSNQRGRRTDGGIAAEITLTRIDSLPLAPHEPFRKSSDKTSREPFSPTSSASPSDSLACVKGPLTFDLAWRPAWVYTPFRDGIRRYEVLPAAALDTLPEPARTAAQLFVRDTRLLLPAAAEAE